VVSGRGEQTSRGGKPERLWEGKGQDTDANNEVFMKNVAMRAIEKIALFNARTGKLEEREREVKIAEDVEEDPHAG
jgi:hypothetical protein